MSHHMPYATQQTSTQNPVRPARPRAVRHLPPQGFARERVWPGCHQPRSGESAPGLECHCSHGPTPRFTMSPRDRLPRLLGNQNLWRLRTHAARLAALPHSLTWHTNADRTMPDLPLNHRSFGYLNPPPPRVRRQIPSHRHPEPSAAPLHDHHYSHHHHDHH